MLLNNRAWIWVGVVVCKYQTKRHRAHGDDGGGVHAGKLIVENKIIQFSENIGDRTHASNREYQTNIKNNIE